jgi:DinB family protein
MPIVPDTKNWTWVLERSCPECGFDASQLPQEEVAPLTRRTAQAWAVVLGGAPDTLRHRRTDDMWSPLEYACHVRDVFVLYHERLELMLDSHDPTFANWDQDATAVADAYNDQDPIAVAPALTAAGTRLADRLDGVAGPDWQRTGHRGDGASFTVDSFVRYMIHDPLHHLHDVGSDPAAVIAGLA